jgi:hypothetical protein
MTGQEGLGGSAYGRLLSGNVTQIHDMTVPVGYFDEVDPAENFERQKRFTGRLGDEATLISLSAQVEAARPWRDRHPPLW